jgi:tRNA U55 pseudouridine synthase TruB
VVGRFEIEKSVTLEVLEKMSRDEIPERVLISPGAMLSHLPAITLDRESVSRVMTGRAVASSPPSVESEERFVRLCDEAGALVAVGAYDAAARVVKPRVVLEGKG